MMCLTRAAMLLLGLVSSVKAGVFDKSFLVRMEDITNTNRELTETNRELTNTNRELNATVIEQRTMMSNLTTTIEDLKATVETLNATAAIHDGKLYNLYICLYI